MRFIVAFVVAFVVCFSIVSCTDAQWSQVTSLGDSFRVDLYSGGKLVRTWHSTGKVGTETQSDGYFFRDKETDKLVRVSGDLVVTEE